jgi:predicted phosphodiesterase
MRFGVFSDVHGNLPALEATLSALRRQYVDAYVHLGDLVGYGPFPNECIEVVAGLEPVGVVGNHELIVLGQLSPENSWELAQDSLAWTMGVLTADSRAYIESLPRRATPAETVIATHASLENPERYVTTTEQATDQLERLRQEAPTARLLLMGHTHRPRACAVAKGESRLGRDPLSLNDDVWLLNPGSVGQSRGHRAWASCMVLDLERHEATLISLPYDVDPLRRELRRHGLDSRSYHLSSSRVLGRAAKAVLLRGPIKRLRGR